MRHKQLLAIIPALLLCLPAPASAQGQTCAPDGAKVVVTAGEKSTAIELTGTAYDCVVAGDVVYVALGVAGVAVYQLGEPAPVLKTTWKPDAGEVVRVRLEGGRVMAVMAKLKLVPLVSTPEGGLAPESLSGLLAPAKQGSTAVIAAPAITPEPQAKPTAPTDGISGTVTEIHAENAVIDVGADDGVEKGMRFEIRSQQLVKRFNLKTGTDKMMPSDKVTGVVKVIQVAPGKAMVVLGRGDRAQVGDKAVGTARKLTQSRLFPGYERNLNRVQARVAPFLGLSTLTVGTFGKVMYDRTFDIPLRVETGVRNVGFLFGENFGAPFQFDVIPSYDTDFFEVGLGTGFSYSAHDKKRGFLFMQKVRLGTIDGVNFTMWNSFIYQEKHDEFWGWGDGASVSLAGNDCDPDWDSGEPDGSEFEWNGLDASLSLPVTDRVTLAWDFSWSQAGWIHSDLGIRTLVMGNGGDGTLIIPVSIGGGVVFDYEGTDVEEAHCNPDSTKWEKATVTDWDQEAYGGPVVSIGIDYRWR